MSVQALVGRFATDTPFELPVIDYRLLMPILIILGAGVVSVVIEAFAPRRARRPLQLILVLGSLVAAFIAVVGLAGTQTTTAAGSIAVDGPALVMQGAILVIALLGGLLMAERMVDPSGDAFAPRASALPGSDDERQFAARGYLQTEVWPLFLFAVGGMLLFPASNDLLIMFVALEVMSLPLYLLAGLARRRRLLSQEAAMKYFLLGAFSSAFFLYGAALIYGYAGSVDLPVIAAQLSGKPSESAIVLIGLGMLLVGLLFKIGAVPFHQWTPDVYQGAPTAVTGFMAATVKIAAFGALFRVLYVAFGGMRWDWAPMMWIVAILTMLIGSIIAITQTDIKRMLAYSSIAQAGFILVGLIAASPAGLAGAMFYLIAYGFTTIGAFAVITMVRDGNGEATHLSKWAGLGKKSPLVATLFSVFMLSLAGIPLTSGFIGKFSVFTAAIEAGAGWLVIVAVVASLIAAFFYVRVIVLMFFSEPNDQTATVAIPSVFTTIALAAAATITIVLGIVPQPLIELLANADVFVR
ncbi:MAG: NADH-quinone oxidoreductase subunit NuoN [Actinobacteria bacterium]|nr:NADH-quinone oxidoreductase subunit NuoN [Actinomycetota bacterium]